MAPTGGLKTCDRQSALERVGWIFWRCWGSHWIADPEGCLADLKVTLNRLGIEPIGMAAAPGVYTQHIHRQPPEAALPPEVQSEKLAGPIIVAPTPTVDVKPPPAIKAEPARNPATRFEPPVDSRQRIRPVVLNSRTGMAERPAMTCSRLCSSRRMLSPFRSS